MENNIYKVGYYKVGQLPEEYAMLGTTLTRWLYLFDIVQRYTCSEFEVIITSLDDMILIYHK